MLFIPGFLKCSNTRDFIIFILFKDVPGCQVLAGHHCHNLTVYCGTGNNVEDGLFSRYIKFWWFCEIFKVVGLIILFFRFIFLKCRITKQSFINLQGMSLM